MTGPAAALLSAAAALAAPQTASAHPHVWVTVATTVNYENGSISGLNHTWTFDEMYTAMAIQGLDKNGDGTYDKDELAELTKVNMDGLKEFDYFTFAKLGTEGLKLTAPTDAWLEHKNNILTLHFTTPLEKPVLAEADGFTFQIYDPSYFIAFDLAKENPVKLSEAAPQNCKAAVVEPKTDANSDDLKSQLLNDAFAKELGATTNIGDGFTKTISVACAKS